MARRIVFPDVNDRTPNEPSVLVSAAQVLAYYNQQVVLTNSLLCEKKASVDDQVKEFFIKAGTTFGWTEVRFMEKQCLLTAKFEPKQHDQSFLLPPSRNPL